MYSVEDVILAAIPAALGIAAAGMVLTEVSNTVLLSTGSVLACLVVGYALFGRTPLDHASN